MNDRKSDPGESEMTPKFIVKPYISATMNGYAIYEVGIEKALAAFHEKEDAIEYANDLAESCDGVVETK